MISGMLRTGINRGGTVACLALASLAIAACDEGPSDSIAGHDHIVGIQPDRGPAAGPEGTTRAELAQARAATARYQRIEVALSDGYVDLDLFIPGMGFHFLNPGLVDGTFEVDRPELLVYWPEDNGRMRLVAVEYAVPLELSPDAPPEGFTGSDDSWFRDETFQLWTLHAWVWHHNPDGVFAPFNPRLQ